MWLCVCTSGVFILYSGVCALRWFLQQQHESQWWCFTQIWLQTAVMLISPTQTTGRLLLILSCHNHPLTGCQISRGTPGLIKYQREDTNTCDDDPRPARVLVEFFVCFWKICLYVNYVSFNQTSSCATELNMNILTVKMLTLWCFAGSYNGLPCSLWYFSMQTF